MQNFEIGKISEKDSLEYANLHINAFKGFFLSSLGIGFLSLFYKHYAEHSSAIAISIREHKGGDILGVVVGSLNPGGLYSSMLKNHFFSFVYECLKNAITKPSVIFRLLRGAFYRGDEPKPGGTLMASILVVPKAQRRGVGQLLAKSFLREAAERGASFVFATTDANANDSVNKFYRELGFRLEKSYKTQENRLMNMYVHDFTKDSKQV